MALMVVLLLAGCARPALDPQAHVPAFARKPFEPFSRASAVAIALREWRLFGQLVDDAPPEFRPTQLPEDKPERQAGLWQRVGEYWWLGMDAGAKESGWTGKHDTFGATFPADMDGEFAWSAAFISYVMRIAGAGARFPYSASHYTYIDAAREVSLGRAQGWVVSAEDPAAYAPSPGDIICTTRGERVLAFADLPAGRFPAHCDIVVALNPGELTVVGGNVDDAVTMKHVPIGADGKLDYDRRYPWFVVLRIAYDQ
jgi:hypothetical protein